MTPPDPYKIKYTSGKPIERTGCYCGGTLKSTDVAVTKRLVKFKDNSDHTDQSIPEVHYLLNACEVCRRLYLVNGSSEPTLLVPWTKIPEEGNDDCIRCGHHSEHNLQTDRYKCLNPLCALEWRGNTKKSVRESHLEILISDAKEAIKQAEDDVEVLKIARRLKTFKDELAALQETKV